ncbi:MAG: hypothetical protein WB709_10395 [Solirubrobacteraceae bacterium]
MLGEGKLVTLKAGTKEITCHKMRQAGTVSPGGLAEATELHFSECLTNQTGCDPHTAGAPNGLIVFKNIPTALTLREVASGGGVKIVAEEYKSNPTTKEFGTVEFSTLAGGSCSEFPTSKYKGQFAGEVLNATEEINFPEPELKGNTFEVFGKAGSIVARFTQMLANGGKLTAS